MFCLDEKFVFGEEVSLFSCVLCQLMVIVALGHGDLDIWDPRK